MADLRRFGLLELFLAAVWAFSPLGGQAILRVLWFGTALVPSSAPLQYVSYANTSFPVGFLGSDPGPATMPVDALFLSSLSAPEGTRNSPMDTWGNIMIPMIEALPQYARESSPAWIPVGGNGTNITYASLIGVPTGNIPRNLSSTFNLETSYWNIQCPELRQVLGVDIDAVLQQLAGPSNTSCAPMGCRGAYSWGSLAWLPSQNGQTGKARCSSINEPRGLVYLSWDADHNATLANCTMQTSYVELSVSCGGWSCNTTAARPSTRAHPTANFTVFDDCQGSDYPFVWPYFAELFGNLGGFFAGGAKGHWSIPTAAPTALQAYMVDPDQAMNATVVLELPGLYTVGPGVFSTRLSQLMNSYWMAAVATEAVFLGHPHDYAAIKSSSAGVGLADTTVVVMTPVTVVPQPRVAGAAGAVGGRHAGGRAGVAVGQRASAGARILMNVSTMTRGNPNFGLPDGGGTLPDEARSRLLRQLRVRFGDGSPGNATATSSWGGSTVRGLAIGDCAEDGGHVSRIRRDDVYV